jgi:hypothetical protein
MSDSKSPIICVTCQRSFPEDLKAEDSPRYFAQGPLLPRSDDDHDFKDEADNILSFIESISYVTRYATEVEEEHYKTILSLLLELSEEAKRRLALVDSAMRERWDRDHGHNAPARKEGRA